VAFPHDVLTADERVLLHLRPHWKAMIGPVLAGVLAIAILVAALGWSGNQAAVIAAVVLALVIGLWLSFWPWLVWRSTHYVFTNERVMLRSGVLSRDRRDIPLNRISDHSTKQTLTDRSFGCGTMTIESAGESGQSVLHSIPDIDRVQTTLNEIIDQAVRPQAPIRSDIPAPERLPHLPEPQP
jgi:uncharacterized membrane protein YdbT with pleckstrin-like domain